MHQYSIRSSVARHQAQKHEARFCALSHSTSTTANQPGEGHSTAYPDDAFLKALEAHFGREGERKKGAGERP